jgi:molybdopterin/thiamine biosynthesis adenylyltransferase
LVRAWDAHLVAAEKGSEVSEPVWIIDDADRYDRLRLISWWDQQRLRQARVLVVGAGALGNEVIKNLVLLGVGTIYLVDFDTIEASNLSRSVFFRDQDRGQFKAQVLAQRAGELNPDSQIVPLQENVMLGIGLGLVRSLDAVVGCLDNREARLWVNRLCWKVGVPWIDGGIQELNGVVKVYVPPDGSCYECTMTENDYRLMQLRYSCPLLKREDVQAGRVPTAPTIASMIGAWQVQELLKLLHQIPSDQGTALVFNGLANQFYKSRLPRREDCMSHETYEEIVDTPWTNQATVAQILGWGHELTGEPMELILDRDWVQALVCDHCQSQEAVGQPAMAVEHRSAECACGQIRRPQMVGQVGPDSELAPLRLADLGIPDWDVVKLRGAGQREWFLALSPCQGDHRPALPCPVDPAVQD